MEEYNVDDAGTEEIAVSPGSRIPSTAVDHSVFIRAYMEDSRGSNGDSNGDSSWPQWRYRG